MYFSILRESCSHHHNMILEHFHHHQMKPHSYQQSLCITLLFLNLTFPPFIILTPEKDLVFLNKF